VNMSEQPELVTPTSRAIAVQSAFTPVGPPSGGTPDLGCLGIPTPAGV
jgi:hypothetical protein